MSGIPVALTLKVDEKDKLDFVTICNQFDVTVMLNIPNRLNPNKSYNPKNASSIKDYDLSQEFTMTIRGEYTDKQIEMLNEWRIR